MKTRAVFYLFAHPGTGSIEGGNHLRDFTDSAFGFSRGKYVSFCENGFRHLTGIALPRRGLFRATLIVKRITARKPK